MPINFYVALGAVFALCLGIVGYVWLTTSPAKADAEQKEFDLQPQPMPERRTSGHAMAGAGRR